MLFIFIIKNFIYFYINFLIMSSKEQDWKYIGKGKLIAEDKQIQTIAQDGEIFETATEYKVVKPNGKERRFNKSIVMDVKIR